MRRLLVVYNPNSSQYIHVKREFLSELPKLKSVMVGKFTIEKAPFSKNVTRLKKVLKPGDTVIAAGGDATASVCLNAILESGKDITLGVLPYGNFNDLARTLGTMKKDDILDYVWASDSDNIRAGDARGRVPAKLPKGGCRGRDNGRQDPPRIVSLYLIDIIVDGKHWRYASGYVTAGMTAEAVELFDAPKFRKYMQQGHKSSWRSYLALAKWYFKNRHKHIFIPEFTLNGQPTKKGISDYCALSGRSMCRVMKGGDDYLKPQVFRSENCRLVSFPRLCALMFKAIFFRTPGTETTRDLLEFTHPATIELQAEGEYQVFKDVKTIEIIKPTDKSIKVIHKERR
ncbi:acylglycerol kinase family protein [Candidatus Saccharibacteria bacterium]|nr:acylglycerol kinase family protein [Candidatus Saccharibacteria bacterium]